MHLPGLLVHPGMLIGQRSAASSCCRRCCRRPRPHHRQLLERSEPGARTQAGHVAVVVAAEEEDVEAGGQQARVEVRHGGADGGRRVAEKEGHIKANLAEGPYRQSDLKETSG